MTPSRNHVQLGVMIASANDNAIDAQLTRSDTVMPFTGSGVWGAREEPLRRNVQGHDESSQSCTPPHDVAILAMMRVNMDGSEQIVESPS